MKKTRGRPRKTSAGEEMMKKVCTDIPEEKEAEEEAQVMVEEVVTRAGDETVNVTGITSKDVATRMEDGTTIRTGEKPSGDITASQAEADMIESTTADNIGSVLIGDVTKMTEVARQAEHES
jgi:hypothetical protein